MNIFTFNNLLIILVTILFFVWIIYKSFTIRRLKSEIRTIKKSFSFLDVQAKIMIKSDIKRNRIQKTLDKRLNRLDALHNTSRLISTTLDEKEILQHIKKSLETTLNFEKYALLTYDPINTFKTKITKGFTKEESDTIIFDILRNNDLIEALSKGHNLSSKENTQQETLNLLRLFKVNHFILSPMMSQKKFSGILFVGNTSNIFNITEVDEDLITILANQIGQSLKNAKTFEKVYQSAQLLEEKVQHRTQQLKKELEKTQKYNKAKTEFISTVSHELRTPLTSIKGYTAILISEKLGKIPDKAKERLKKINIHSNNLVNLVNILLDVANIESDNVQLDIKESSVKEIINNIQDIFMPQIQNNNIHFKTHIPSNLPPIHIDVCRYTRIFINLISNAIKFTPEQGTITINVTADSNRITISISNTGIGIEEKDIPRLFDQFYRVDNSINQVIKGSGLGLSLTKKIVEIHGGKIWVTSTRNSETTFYFTLPLNNNTLNKPK